MTEPGLVFDPTVNLVDCICSLAQRGLVVEFLSEPRGFVLHVHDRVEDPKRVLHTQVVVDAGALYRLPAQVRQDSLVRLLRELENKFPG